MNKQRNLVIGLIIVLVLVIFACLNTEPVAINFGFFQPKMPLIIVLVIMLLLGALVSLLIGKGEKVSPDVKKALAKQKKELDNKYQSEIESKDKQIADMGQQLSQMEKQLAELKAQLEKNTPEK